MSFDVRFDVAEVEALRTRIDLITDESIGVTVKRAVNEVAERTYTMLIPRMTRTVNLSDEFVRERVALLPAVPTAKQTVQATIIAPIRKGSPHIKVNPIVTLRRFSPVQEIGPVRWPNGSFKPGRKGPHPTKPGSFLPWKVRTGDPLRGIPPNSKARGISVEVTKGSRKRIATAFFLPLRRGNEVGGNGLGVVRREADGSIRTLKGPMPYQIMRGIIPEIEEDVERDLRETTTRLLTDEIDRALIR